MQPDEPPQIYELLLALPHAVELETYGESPHHAHNLALCLPLEAIPYDLPSNEPEHLDAPQQACHEPQPFHPWHSPDTRP